MRIKVQRGLDRSVPQLLLRDLGGYADVVQDRSMYVTQKPASAALFSVVKASFFIWR